MFIISCLGLAKKDDFPEYKSFPFQRGQVYELHEDLLIYNGKTPHDLTRIRPNNKKYINDKTKFLGVLKKGTVIKVNNLYKYPRRLSGVIHVESSVMSGKHKDLLVDLWLLVRPDKNSYGSIDENVIQKKSKK